MSSENSTGEEFLLAQENRQFLEELIVVAAIKDADFFSKFGTVICGARKDGYNVTVFQDFDSYLHRSIWVLIRMYWDIYGSSGKVPFVLALPQISTAAVRQGTNSIMETDIPELQKEVMRLLFSSAAKQHEGLKPVLNPAVRKWLYNKRYKYLAAKLQIGSMTPDEMDEQIRELRETLIITDDVKYRFGFGEEYVNDEEGLEKIDTPWPSITGMLAGGWALGDSTLWVAPSGAGKTVIAMQVAAHAANMGYNVQCIFSEQTHYHMNGRAVSAICSVPFEGMITEGAIDWTKMSPSVNEARQRMRQHLIYADFVSGGKTILKDLDAEIKAGKEAFNGDLKMVTVDWVGALLGPVSDESKIRLMYKAACYHVADLAKKHGVHIHMFAQANETLVKNKKYVTSDMVSECKACHDKATNAFGVSKLQISESASGDSTAVITDRQYFTAFKARKNQGKVFPMDRDFGFQRFADVTAGQSKDRNTMKIKVNAGPFPG